MKHLGVLLVLCSGLVVSCAGASQSGREETTPHEEGDSAAQRFAALEGVARELDVDLVGQLPEVSDDDVFLIVDSVISAPSYDADQGGWILEPPEAWVVGSTSAGEEVRLEFLEPEGGVMVVTSPPGSTLPDEVSVTWLVRYARRNTLLTEAGAAVAVHVVPVAAMLEAEGQPARYWISSEANP